MIRFEFDGRVEEKGGQQFVSGRGAYGDGWTRIHRIEPHGEASMPVKGAKGLLLPMPGAPETAFVLGGEHPDLRPADLPGGGKAIYDAGGNVLKMVMGDGITIDVGGSAYVVRKGGVSLTVSASGVAIVGNVTVTGNVDVSGSVVDGDGNNGA